MKPRVHLLFKTPQLWWAYLASISNPMLRTFADGVTDVVCYDHERDPRDARVTSIDRTRYVRIFWDGIRGCDEIEEALLKSPAAAHTSIFVIGIDNCGGVDGPPVRPLYTEGELSFSPASVRLAGTSLVQVSLAKLKSILVPAKNILRRTGSLGEALRLLAGKRRVVFCGSFGLHPQALSMLAKRYGVRSQAVLERQWCSLLASGELSEYIRAYLEDLKYLAEAHGTQDISDLFLVACVRLLDREYLIRHLEHSGVPTYTSQFGTSYIDVYSTPFYRQHVFLDFGSTVGVGNYPRSVDLAYYDKTVLPFVFSADATELLQGIRQQAHEPRMAERWHGLSVQVSRLQ